MKAKDVLRIIMFIPLTIIWGIFMMVLLPVIIIIETIKKHRDKIPTFLIGYGIGYITGLIAMIIILSIM